MSREVFLEKLESLLADLDSTEKAEAVQYYREYFEDSEKDEAEVIRELGSPEEVAHNIREELEEKEVVVANTNYKSADSQESTQSNTGYSSEEKEDTSKKKDNTAMIVAIILLAVFLGIPVGVPLVSAIFGVVVGIYATLAALVVAAAICCVVFGVCALILFIFAIAKLFVSPFAGVIALGASITLLGLCLLCALATWKLCLVVIPGLTKGLVYLCRLPFHKKEAVA